MDFQSHRIIYHIDADSFFASVEETLHPELRKVPMAICGDPKSRRGVILAKNFLAKGCGVKTAETIWQAKQKCPGLVLAPSRFEMYRKFCKRLNEIYEEYTDQVERLSIDESFLDVTGSLGLFGKSPLELAKEIQSRVKETLDITVSIGISYNKIFAKMGSDINKPNGICVITPENYKEMIWPMPASKLYSVGKVAAQNLSAMGISTIGQIAAADPVFLKKRMGKAGEKYYSFANGQDNRPVLKANEAEPAHSVGNGRTFRRDLISAEDIKIAVTALSDTVATRLRHNNMKCATLQVTIKDPNFKVITRQSGVQPTWLASDISKEALRLIQASWKIGKPIRLLTITASALSPADEVAEQLSWFHGPQNTGKSQKKEKLEKTLDSIREKYGMGSISQGSIIKNDLGINDHYSEESLNRDKEE